MLHCEISLFGVLDVRLYAAGKKRVPSDCFLSISKKHNTFSPERNFFPILRQPQIQVNPLHVDRAATD